MRVRIRPPWMALAFLAACSSPEAPPEIQIPYAAEEVSVEVGGRNAVRLTYNGPAAGGPHFVNADLLPGRGMNIFQIRAHLPGRGVTELLWASSLDEAAQRMNGRPEDLNGNESFKMGGAILLPYANRIRGKWIEESREIETTIAGQTVRLPANWRGQEPEAELHAMHGLILNAKMDSVELAADDVSARVSSTLAAGDFGGHWLSSAHVNIDAELEREAFTFRVTVRNVGDETLPIGIGWHPYFVFPSGNREQARLHIPARQRAAVTNYDDVFPTGELKPLVGTNYDFSKREGARLNVQFLDDCFVDLIRDPEGRVVARVIDPAAEYGLRVIGLSPEVQAFQVYAPVELPFVALEPQYNWADPYSEIWGDRDTGMVELAPGESTTYSVRLEVFQP